MSRRLGILVECIRPFGKQLTSTSGIRSLQSLEGHIRIRNRKPDKTDGDEQRYQ